MEELNSTQRDLCLLQFTLPRAMPGKTTRGRVSVCAPRSIPSKDVSIVDLWWGFSYVLLA